MAKPSQAMPQTVEPLVINDVLIHEGIEARRAAPHPGATELVCAAAVVRPPARALHTCSPSLSGLARVWSTHRAAARGRRAELPLG